MQAICPKDITARAGGKNGRRRDLTNRLFSSIILPMAIEVRKRDGDSPNAILFNFTKRMKRSGVMKEVRKRKFHTRTTSRIKRRSSAIHREEKRKEVERLKKLGLA